MSRHETNTAWREPLGFRPNIITFHKLSPRFSYSWTNFSPRRFGKLLERLYEAGFTSASLDDILTYAAPRRFAITFDDGYERLRYYLPRLMEQYGLRPTIFIPTYYIGKPNSWDYSYHLRPEPHLRAEDIREFARLGVEFGSHGHRHHALTHVEDDEFESELIESKAILEDLLGREVRTIAYPFGKADEKVFELAARAGYRYGFTTVFPSESDCRLGIGRYTVYGYDSQLAVIQKLNRGPLHKLERAKAGLASGLARGTIALQKLKRRGRRDQAGS